MKKILFATIALATLSLVACNNNNDAHLATEANPNDILDPVCNMVKTDSWVDSSSTHGQMFYFCSPVCKEQFDKDPHKYMGEHTH